MPRIGRVLIRGPLPFGPSLYALLGQVSAFGLFSVTTFISGSRLLPQVAVNHTAQSEPPTARMLRIHGAGGRNAPSRFRCHPWRSARM